MALKKLMPMKLIKTIGPSMLPTIDSTPSLFIMENISIRFGKVHRGDIVVLRHPQIPSRTICKRVVGLENDSFSRIAFRGNSPRLEMIVVPKGRVWVEGDNKSTSDDSRKFGPVLYDLIEGRLIWRLAPWKSFGPFWHK